MTAVDKVFKAFGSQANAARALNYSLQRLQHWKGTGNVPANAHAYILRIAKENKVKLKPVDLVNCE